MIPIVQIIAAIQSAWELSESKSIPTQFPGTVLDATRLSTWFEFWITHLAEPPQRHAGLQSMDVQVDVHCYARGHAKHQVFEMADDVRTALAHHQLPFGGVESGGNSSGIIRIHEAVIRDLTRESTPEPRLPLQHVLVSLGGRVEQTTL